MQLDNFFGKTFAIDDYNLGNCCKLPEETTAEKLLEKIAVFHEKMKNLYGKFVKL